MPAHSIEWLSRVIDAAPVALTVVDSQGRVVFANPAMEALVGRDRGRLMGEVLSRVAPSPGGASRWTESVWEGERYRIGAFASPSTGVDTAVRQEAEELHRLAALNEALEREVAARRAQLRERETLIQEIHHRIKNNLQIICSLIMMQARSVEDPAVQTALRECRSRVATMADIHEMLYQSCDYSRVPFGKFVEELASRISSASELSPGSVGLTFDVEPLAISVDRAIPCGLILNELVTNSLKHAFPGGRGGRIEISLRQTAPHRVVLSVRDDGIGIGLAAQDWSASPTLAPAKSLGVQLIRSLAGQLRADIRRSGPPGTCYDISFPTEA